MEGINEPMLQGTKAALLRISSGWLVNRSGIHDMGST